MKSNIVIGKPDFTPAEMFARDEQDWEVNEKDDTFFTEERYLPKILVELGYYPSVSEIRRNRPDLMLTLDKAQFIDKLKVKKKSFVWILVGDKDEE